jgi:hypothetical protein
MAGDPTGPHRGTRPGEGGIKAPQLDPGGRWVDRVGLYRLNILAERQGTAHVEQPRVFGVMQPTDRTYVVGAVYVEGADAVLAVFHVPGTGLGSTTKDYHTIAVSWDDWEAMPHQGGDPSDR